MATSKTSKGNIGVTTENIFPVIKKFLYSDHEIFLRELVANGVDACTKMQTISNSDSFKGELGELKVTVTADEKNNTLVIEDNGVGMTKEEVDRYINQIAFSGAGEFLEKYKDQTGIIGHFGLGFYSAFMVSKKVTIDTLSWQEGATAVKWECKGEPEYEMGKGERSSRGTTITLELDDEEKEFSTEARVKELLRKYCHFMAVPVFCGKAAKPENNQLPIWTKKPSELKDEDYDQFYRDLYPMQDEPLFHIHLNVDYPFNLTGVLYFPKIKDKIEATRNKIQLYCNQVFVTDQVENIVPDFLTLLHGVIDSPDIPLNVSRSYLQSDAAVKKISSYITKKVADRLEDIFKNNRAEYEEKWDNLKLFIEYGMLSEEKFAERAMKFCLLKNTDGKYLSLDEYKSLIEPLQKDKDGNLVYLYASDTQEQYTFIEAAKGKGYDVLLLDCPLDSHFVGMLETKLEKSRFMRVDADTVEKLIVKEDKKDPELDEQNRNDLSYIFEAVLPEENSYNVKAENLGETGVPILITQSEWMRRYREMSSLGGGMNFYGEMPKSYTIGVNVEHPLIKKILGESNEVKVEEPVLQVAAEDASEEDKKKADAENKRAVDALRKDAFSAFAKENTLLHQVVDLALLGAGLLKGKDLAEFIKRSTEILA